MKEVTKIIYSLFRNVLVKGGDLPDSADAVDVLFDGKIQVFNSEIHQFFFSFTFSLIIKHANLC